MYIGKCVSTIFVLKSSLDDYFNFKVTKDQINLIPFYSLTTI